MSFSSIKKPLNPQDIVSLTPTEHLNYIKSCVVNLAAKGYQPLPLTFGTKKPYINEWSNLPTITSENCLTYFDPGKFIPAANKQCEIIASERVNVGLILGRPLPNPVSGVLLALDLDDKSERSEEFGETLLDMFRDAPGKLVLRKGSKGFQFFIRVLAPEIHSSPGSKTKHKIGLELLAKGRQSCLAPSVWVDDKYWKLPQGEGEPDKVDIHYILEHTPEYVHFFKWVTVPLWEVDSDELPLMTVEKWKEIELFRLKPDSSLFELHKASYMGDGAGGGFHEAALKTFGSYYAHNFSREYMLERFKQLSRQACRRGGVEDEFNQSWDVEKEFLSLWEQTEGKFKTGDWSKETFISAGEKLDKNYAVSRDNRAAGVLPKAERSARGRKDVVTRDEGGRPLFQLVTKNEFDEIHFVQAVATELGGFDNLCKIYDPATKARDADYLYWYVEKDSEVSKFLGKGFHTGFWQQLNVNVKESWLGDFIYSHFGLSGAMADIVTRGLLKLVPARSKTEFSAGSSRYVKLRNGTLDLDTLTLIEDSKEHCLTHMIDVEYDPFALAPRYEEFMDSLFTQIKTEEYDPRTPDQLLADKQTSINAYEEFMSNTLIEEDDFQRSLILRGEPNSGKSKAMELVKFFHPQVSHLSWSELDNVNARARLFEVRVNLTDEVDKYEKINASIFKGLIGGAGITYRHLYKNLRDGKPKCRLVFAFNEFPKTIEINNSIERRMIILSCNNIVPSHLRDFKIMQKLEKEKSGILNKWLAALQRLRERGDYLVPASHTIEIEAFRNHNDVLGDFMRERCIPGEGFASHDDLFRAFKGFAEECGHRFIYTKQSFRNRFRREAKARNIESKLGRVGNTSARGYAIRLTTEFSEI